jgi:hypothetical protein
MWFNASRSEGREIESRGGQSLAMAKMVVVLQGKMIVFA